MVLVRRIFRLYGAYRRQTCDIFFATVLALIRNSSILKRHLLIFLDLQSPTKVAVLVLIPKGKMQSSHTTECSKNMVFFLFLRLKKETKSKDLKSCEKN